MLVIDANLELLQKEFFREGGLGVRCEHELATEDIEV